MSDIPPWRAFGCAEFEAGYRQPDLPPPAPGPAPHREPNPAEVERERRWQALDWDGRFAQMDAEARAWEARRKRQVRLARQKQQANE